MSEQSADLDKLRALLREPDAAPARQTLRYGSGRVLTLLDAPGDERLKISAPDGRVELMIRFTPEGPRLEFDSDTLTLSNPGTLELECERFRLQAKQGVEIRSEAEVRVHGEGDVHIDGESVRLNCDDRGRALIPRDEG